MDISQSYRRCITALNRFSKPFQFSRQTSNDRLFVEPSINARLRYVLRMLSDHLSHLVDTSLQDIQWNNAEINRETSAWSVNRSCDYPLSDEPPDYKLLLSVLNGTDNIERKIKYIRQATDILSINTRDDFANFATLEIHSMQDCIDRALIQYVFCGYERDKVEWQSLENFRFFGCKALMTYVIFNLLKNALHAIADKENAHISIHLESAGDFNRLCFRDIGCGIAAHDLPYIFNDFVSHKANAMGLGLGFCRRVMDLIGGRIECQSKEGKYTLFTLSFPVLW